MRSRRSAAFATETDIFCPGMNFSGSASHRSSVSSDQTTVDEPYPLYARLREVAPVTRVTMADGQPGWLDAIGVSHGDSQVG